MSRRKRGLKRGEIALQPVRPNAGVQAAYRRRLDKLIQEMNNSVLYWIKAQYRKNEPIMAQDDIPAVGLREAMRRLAAQWQHRFDEAADELAEYFSRAAVNRTDAQLKSILKKAGIAIPFKMTEATRDILQATIAQNVSLIKSIPDQYLTQVEGDVMRSVQTGRDLKQLTDDIEKQYGVTRRRAAFIARDQNNKATSAINRARQEQLGVTEAIWVHSGGGKEPRPTHLAAGREQVRYNVSEGWFDPHEGKRIFPGELINCRCVSKSIVPGF